MVVNYRNINLSSIKRNYFWFSFQKLNFRNNGFSVIYYENKKKKSTTLIGNKHPFRRGRKRIIFFRKMTFDLKGERIKAHSEGVVFIFILILIFRMLRSSNSLIYHNVFLTLCEFHYSL